MASEKAQLTEACLEANVLRQAAVPGAQAPGDRWYHLGQTNSGGGIYNNTVQLPAVSCLGGSAAKREGAWATRLPAGQRLPGGAGGRQPHAAVWASRLPAHPPTHLHPPVHLYPRRA